MLNIGIGCYKKLKANLVYDNNAMLITRCLIVYSVWAKARLMKPLSFIPNLSYIVNAVLYNLFLS